VRGPECVHRPSEGALLQAMPVTVFTLQFKRGDMKTTLEIIRKVLKIILILFIGYVLWLFVSSLLEEDSPEPIEPETITITPQAENPAEAWKYESLADRLERIE